MGINIENKEKIKLPTTMKTITLMIASSQAARLMHFDCATKIDFNGNPLTYNEVEVAYTGDNVKLAQNPSDKTWMFVSGDNQLPLVSFDQADCVEDNKKWFELDNLSYKPVELGVKRL